MQLIGTVCTAGLREGTHLHELEELVMRVGGGELEAAQAVHAARRQALLVVVQVEQRRHLVELLICKRNI